MMTGILIIYVPLKFLINTKSRQFFLFQQKIWSKTKPIGAYHLQIQVQIRSSIENIQHGVNLAQKIQHTFIDDYILRTFGVEAFTTWCDLDRPFNKEEIKHLATNPYIRFANHTHNHSILTNYTKEEIKQELNLSNKILFETTGRLPIAIAFPNENFNQTVLEATGEEGFRYAFTTKPGINLLPTNY